MPRSRSIRRPAAAALAVVALTAAPALGAVPAASAAATPVVAPAALRHAPFQAAPGARATTGTSPDTTVTSTNWAGYAATGSTYKSVTATWVQPVVKCTSGDQYSAFWVGLDGYSSNTVEQTGTEADCVGKTAAYSAWYEMYPANPVTYADKLKAGDLVTATVAFTGSNKFVLTFTDTTQGWTHATTASAAAARTSAEIIVEAPAAGTGITPISAFGSVDFTGCLVDGKNLGSFDPTRIESGDLTVSAITGGTAFSVTQTKAATRTVG